MLPALSSSLVMESGRWTSVLATHPTRLLAVAASAESVVVVVPELGVVLVVESSRL
jgi:hypothetical protein